MSEHAGTPLLMMRGVTKVFPGVKALDEVNLSLKAGQLVALLGENGAGKSTLMGVLAGVIQPEAGEIQLEGHNVRLANSRQARDLGIAVIFQELSLVPNLTVAENIWLGSEPKTRLGTIDYTKMNQAAQLLLDRLCLQISPEALVGSLRIAQQQGVEIARAISCNARVLIMDEPTSALGRAETERLLRLICELKEAGVAIVYITHKLEELADIADEIAVMRDGRLLAQVPYGTLSQQDIIRLMVGREAAGTCGHSVAAGTEPALTVRRMSVRDPTRRCDYLVRDVTLEVRRGEIVGLFGLVGAGRTELLEAIFGGYGANATGEILIDGHLVHVRSPRDATRVGLGFAPEDRKRDGLVLDMSSRENAALARNGLRRSLSLSSARGEAELARPFLSRLGFRMALVDSPVRNLSGGNQQKVVLAKWLAIKPKVLLLDEPTRGIDVGAKEEFHRCMRELSAEGMGILFASSELPEVISLADRTIVLCEGFQAATFNRKDSTPESLVTAALPRSACMAQSS
jgi:ABC-type sugar transport system ATPase subunit